MKIPKKKNGISDKNVIFIGHKNNGIKMCGDEFLKN